MTTVFADIARLETGWESAVRIAIDKGTISRIDVGTTAGDADERYKVIIPGVGNLHSHAFQRAMAGLAEVRSLSADTFWSWRTAMYRFALEFSPDQLEAVASQLYMEMLEAGFTHVGEFHYLHHRPDGYPYANIAEHAERIAAAAVATGISLTLLPVFYAHSGFGGASPTEHQRRFINSIESYARLMEACKRLIALLPGARLGIAPHSLRAVTPVELQEILSLAEDGPIHIHISEQMQEVEDCIRWSGARPVEWLLANAPVDSRWTLIHATHITDQEMTGIAQRGAIVALCPITEANLGDGTFPAQRFLNSGGCFGIGSDSNISISVSHELRQLEYSQRLALHSRNVIASPGESTSNRLLDEAVKGGVQSLKHESHLNVGREADFVSLKATELSYLPAGAILDRWLFSDGIKVDTVWVRGRKLVGNGRHVDHDRISARFRSMMKDLLQ